MSQRATKPAKVILNGAPVSTTARTLGELLTEQGFAGGKLATAVNGDFVPVRARDTTPVKPGDDIEVVAARQGG